MKYKSINFVEFESDLTKEQARECIQFAQSCNNEDGNFFDPDAMDMSDLDPSYVPSYKDAIHDAFWDQYDWFKCVREIEKADSSGHITNEKEVDQFASKLLDFIYQYLGFNDTKEQIESALGRKRKLKSVRKKLLKTFLGAMLLTLTLKFRWVDCFMMRHFIKTLMFYSFGYKIVLVRKV